MDASRVELAAVVSSLDVGLGRGMLADAGRTMSLLSACRGSSSMGTLSAGRDVSINAADGSSSNSSSRMLGNASCLRYSR